MRTWLKEIRLSKGMTCKQVGQASGTNESNYSMIENGTRGNPLKVDIAKAIGNVLGFDWKRFYDDVEPRKARELS